MRSADAERRRLTSTMGGAIRPVCPGDGLTLRCPADESPARGPDREPSLRMSEKRCPRPVTWACADTTVLPCGARSTVPG